jgi:hypothetical protein
MIVKKTNVFLYLVKCKDLACTASLGRDGKWRDGRTARELPGVISWEPLNTLRPRRSRLPA